MQAKLLIDYTGIKENSITIPVGTIVNVLSVEAENENDPDMYYFVETLDGSQVLDVEPNEIELIKAT
jgi:hypothetical protein